MTLCQDIIDIIWHYQYKSPLKALLACDTQAYLMLSKDGLKDGHAELETAYSLGNYEIVQYIEKRFSIYGSLRSEILIEKALFSQNLHLIEHAIQKYAPDCLRSIEDLVLQWESDAPLIKTVEIYKYILNHCKFTDEQLDTLHTMCLEHLLYKNSPHEILIWLLQNAHIKDKIIKNTIKLDWDDSFSLSNITVLVLFDWNQNKLLPIYNNVIAYLQYVSFGCAINPAVVIFALGKGWIEILDNPKVCYCMHWFSSDTLRNMLCYTVANHQTNILQICHNKNVSFKNNIEANKCHFKTLFKNVIDDIHLSYILSQIKFVGLRYDGISRERCILEMCSKYGRSSLFNYYTIYLQCIGKSLSERELNDLILKASKSKVPRLLELGATPVNDQIHLALSNDSKNIIESCHTSDIYHYINNNLDIVPQIHSKIISCLLTKAILKDNVDLVQLFLKASAHAICDKLVDCFNEIIENRAYRILKLILEDQYMTKKLYKDRNIMSNESIFKKVKKYGLIYIGKLLYPHKQWSI